MVFSSKDKKQKKSCSAEWCIIDMEITIEMNSIYLCFRKASQKVVKLQVRLIASEMNYFSSPSSRFFKLAI